MKTLEKTAKMRSHMFCWLYYTFSDHYDGGFTSFWLFCHNQWKSWIAASAIVASC